MRKLGLAILVLLWVPACHHESGAGDGGTDAGVMIAGGDLVLDPPEVTLDIMAGVAGPSQAYTARTMSGTDVTSMAVFTVDDATLGSFVGSAFTASGMHGGTTYVRASWQGMSGFATIHAKLHASVTSDSCPGCPAFPPDTTPACTASVATPTVVYPPDGVLVPPNMNVMATQFDQGMGNALFEIDYENAATDVRVLTRCNPITDTKSAPTNGCTYDLSQQVWDFLSQANRGGDPLDIIVRATDSSGSCIATSQGKISIRFGQEDLNGGIYYWQSVQVTGLMGAAGGIFRYDFGKRGQLPTAFLAPTATGGNKQRCIGCHFLSRDGKKMTYNDDDGDADDEYSDVKGALLDVDTKAVVALKQPGFQAFAPYYSRFVASNGIGMAGGPMGSDPLAFQLLDGTTGMASTPASVSTGPKRGTQPDWSADGSKIVFVQPSNFMFPTYNRADDNHFTGGSLLTMTVSGATFGSPSPLLASAGENNYYPAFSPDGAFVVFNRVPLTGTANACTANSCPNDSFSNPSARVMLLPAAGGTAVDLSALNGAGTLSNSWPRFAPTVQTYKGSQIAWVTFSSTRDYGDVVRNSALIGGAAQHICYPPESPENTSTNKNVTGDPICMQPQLWMAAIDLGKAGGGTDASFPAFWLPFQDASAHNHIAQWVVSIEDTMCVADNAPCTATGNPCCNGICCDTTNICGCVPVL